MSGPPPVSVRDDQTAGLTGTPNFLLGVAA